MKWLFLLCVTLSVAVVVAFYVCPQRVDSSRFMKTKQDIRAIESGLEIFYLDYKRYPVANEGLVALTDPPKGKPENLEKYFDRLPRDAWGNEYKYLPPTRKIIKPRIYSYGPNGFDDKGKHDDIVSWEKEYTCELNYKNCEPPLCDRITWGLLLITAISWLILILMFVIYKLKYIFKH